MPAQPIVIISSYPPRLCGIGTFAEEAREFIMKKFPEREVLVISHTDGAGDGVHPIIDMTQRTWWKPVADLVEKLDPYAVHIQHEYGLYEYHDERGRGDGNAGFLELLDALAEHPVIVEPHTVHGRLNDFEANFVYEMCRRAGVVLFKCHYQKWRLEWTFPNYGWPLPTNILVVPHGARSDKRWGPAEIPELKRKLGLDKYPSLSNRIVGLVGWIQSNKRWDILTSIWEECAEEIKERTGEEWGLMAAGAMRDPHHKRDYEKYKNGAELLEQQGLAHYFEFVPRGDQYYMVVACCDFVVLPSVDETQSGTLARIIALNKPFITTAPMEGLTAQALESGGGFLFTNKALLKDRVIKLATDENLRFEMGENLKKYLDEVVSWEVVVDQYAEAYELAISATKGRKVELPLEF
ncbi:MAG: glycosyltransferase [Planctomycetota bacterium]